MVILGISDSLTSGVAVIVDGRIAAVVNEERLSRQKMAMGFPYRAISECLEIAGVEGKHVERVAVATRDLYWRPEPEPVDGFFDADWGTTKEMMLTLSSVMSRMTSGSPMARRTYYRLKSLLTRKRHTAIIRQLQERWGITAPVRFIDHHLSHVASAYFSSGFNRAAVITIDGAGDGISSAVYKAQDGKLSRLAEIDSFDSIGNYYAYVTHLCGFKAHRHEGKITGLAALGEPEYVEALQEMVQYRDGRIVNTGKAYHHAAIEKLRAKLPRDFSKANLACSIQTVLEDVVSRFTSHWMKAAGESDLALAGGVAANVKLNQRLHALPEVNRTFIHPGMGDEGLALGAALITAARHDPHGYESQAIDNVYFGRETDEKELERLLEQSGHPFERPADLPEAVAELLVANAVVARFDGRMEYGPRALGNRSILYETRDPSVNTWLNKRLQRTEFMPFAPVTLQEHAADLYDDMGGAEHAARFMTITFDGSRRLREESPACVHVDGTARPQILHRETNPGYYDIIEAYRRRTGIPTLVNTSFNMHEEPIVCTPQDALRTWERGHLDALILGPFLVRAQQGKDR